MTALDDAIAELDNWGRWGRLGDGPHGYGEPSIWNAWLSFKSHVAGWGLTAAEQEAEAKGIWITQPDDWRPPIDEMLAQTSDALMRRLRIRDPRSYVILRRHFYKLRRQPDDDLFPALRQYLDLTLDNGRNMPMIAG